MAINGHKIVAIIPALNEEASVGKVITELPDVVDLVVVCDNASIDRTASVARQAGAIVVEEAERGYGAACLKAISVAPADTGILLFIDADYSDYPAEAIDILEQIVNSDYDMVIGSRMMTYESHKALPPVAAFGNWLTSHLIRVIWGVRFTDIGPFRAIKYARYRELQMKDRNFGWTTEMQVKAVKRGLRCTEVPVRYRARIGKSKISGTISGSIKAGSKFLWIILREALTR